ncbi:TonB-dependent receptor [Lentimicrobium sp. S6]|uniref:TonB-dependent receptor n=1 Tax=Lentimicrobium sp. S6 TaxID=2735872 RepID=UPI001553890D|nr:TonB-dependent receptor [Lentimicrobium sp. S6]NPD43993.1 TonB-dependent receptor [Lentimicrobium sp. S6]
MSKFFMLLIGMAFLYNASYAQMHFELKGMVVDENNQALAGASVFLFPVKKGSITNANGDFVMEHLPAGKYKIEISFIGYQSLIDTISINGHKTINYQLEVSALSLQEIEVNDNYIENRKKEESLNVEIVNEEYLKQNLGGSLMNSLERLPGISSIGIGSGQSKPVIRGLGFNRVVVVENNIKHEAQQWGTDHGLEIDQYAVDNIEVIKGPASLMYGSDAIGGIIDMKKREIHAKNSFGGSVDLLGKTNNDLLGTSISMFMRKNWFFADIRATIMDYGDYKVPTDSVDIYSYRAPLYNNNLRNTAGKEKNLHLSFGMIKDQFQSHFYISSVNSKSGFFANAHGLEPRNIDTDLHDQSNRDILYPYQLSRHLKATNSSFYRWDKLKIELDLGYQRNFRQEWSPYVQHGYMPAVFPDSMDFNPDLERQFTKNVYSGHLKFHYQLSDKIQLKFGLNSEFQDNQIDGRGFIIPEYQQFNMGGFVFGKYFISEKSIIQAGIRYDYGNIETQEYYDWFTSPVIENGDTTMQYLQRAENINRSFSNFTWSLGYNYNPGKWSYKVNIGKSFRMPIAKELAANGVNYHHFSYEVGNANLSPEISYQIDMGLEYHNKRFAIGATPFFNYFTNYIYLNPTSEHDRLYGNGNQVFYYTQSEVLRYGAELHAHFELYKWLQLGLIGEYVYSEQMSGEKKGFTLPFSPPPSGILNVKFQQPSISFIKNAYFSVDYRMTAAQNNIVPPEEKTDGYQVFNLSFGGDVNLRNQKINISMQVQNLLNTKYFNHTSYYRMINVPEPGRNFIVNISIPFSGIIKEK